MTDKPVFEHDVVTDTLLSYAEPAYKNFQCRLMPTVERNSVIGVRTPVLRRFAAEISGTPTAESFLSVLPHGYYEENNLHAALIERIADYERVVSELDRFLPYVNNWATCDMMSPRAFKKRPAALLPQLEKWVCSDRTYAVRFGIGMLMKLYLNDITDTRLPELVSTVNTGEYYIGMMAAWYYATGLAKNYTLFYDFLQRNQLDDFTHNMTIKKAIESYRLTDRQKAELRLLKRTIVCQA